MLESDNRQMVFSGLAAGLVAALGIICVRYDFLWVFAPLTAGLFAGSLVFISVKHRNTAKYISSLDEMLEGTRQHVTLLARHTRELHDAFSQSMPGWPMPQSGSAVSADDFSVLSTLVRDLADSMAELDGRCEALDRAMADIRRQRDGAGRQQGAATGWVANAHHTSPNPAHSAYIGAGSSHPGTAPSTLRPSTIGKRVALAPTPPSFAQSDDFLDDANDWEKNEVEPRHPAENRTKQPRLFELSSPSPAQFASEAGQEPSREIRQLVAAAIAADRFELYLHRIVSLPQRKIRGYDVMLRPEGAERSLENGTIRAAVESVGHQLMFDRRMMVQAVRLARAFAKRGRDVLLFLDVSQRLLMSRDALDEVSSLLLETPGLASRIVLSLPARFYQKAASFEREALRELSGLGFTFMARDVHLEELDFASLSSGGVRWIRLSSDEMLALAEEEETPFGFVAADLPAILLRQNITLLVDQVADEPMIAELLDVNVAFAQGNAFAPAQLVQAETFDASNISSSATRPQPKPEPERRGLRDIARRTGA